MGAWDEVVKDSRTRLGERDDCLSDEQVAEVMSWPNAILAANEVVEAVRKYKLAAHEIHASPITNRTTVECATFIWDNMCAALKKLEEEQWSI